MSATEHVFGALRAEAARATVDGPGLTAEVVAILARYLPAVMDSLADAWDEGWRAANASSYTAPLAGDNPYRGTP